MQDKIDKARAIKEEKERLRVLVEERKKIELNRKLKSANAVR